MKPLALLTRYHGAVAAVAAAIVAAFVVSMFIHEDECDAEDAHGVFECIEFLPTSWWFYTTLALLAAGYGAWHWFWRESYLQKTREAISHSPLHESDRAVVLELRSRALSSRAKASVLLAGVVASLFVGLYFSVYVSPYVRDKDQLVAEGTAKERYATELTALKAGRYWLLAERVEVEISGDPLSIGGANFPVKVPEGSAKAQLQWQLVVYETSSSWRFLARPAPVHLSENGKGEDMEVTAVAFLEDSGVIGTKDGALHVTEDGGASWQSKSEFDLKDSEWVTGAVFAHEDLQLVVGHKGSVFLNDRNGAWKRSTYWQSKESVEVTAVEFEKAGTRGVVGTKDGTLHSTQDSGETWNEVTPNSLGLKDDEWVDGALMTADGSLIIRGNRGSMRVRAKRQAARTMRDAWTPPEGNANASRDVTFAAFRNDGERAAIGTTDGSLHWTINGGQEWTRTTRRELGLKRNEWVIEALVLRHGPVLIVGDEGSVKVHTQNGWVDSSIDAQASVTVVEFDDNKQLGAIGTIGGSLHWTINGGETWTTETRGDLGLRSTEWVTEVVVSRDGPVLAVGDEGSIKSHTESGWVDSPIDAQDVTVVEFDDEGQRGLIGTKDGSLYWTSDAGRKWTKEEDLGLEPDEWVIRATLTPDGSKIVMGNKTSERIRIGDNWTDLDFGSDGSIRFFEFDERGQYGVIGTFEGPLYWTDEGGRSWKKWNPHELGLDSDEDVESVVVLSTGKRLIVGTEGTVMIGSEGDEMIATDIWSSVVSARFRHGLQHGLITLREDILFVTVDGGTTWARVLDSDSERGATMWIEEGYNTVNRERDFRTDGEGIAIHRDGKWTYPEAWNVVTMAHKSGSEGLIGTSDGALHVTVDDGKTWKSMAGTELGLEDGEWIVEALRADDDRWVVIGDQGTVRVDGGVDGREWVRPPLPGSQTDRVLFAGGKSGILVSVINVIDRKGGKEGMGREAILADGVAWFWNRRKEGDVPLYVSFDEGETAVAIALDDDRPIVLGSKGTVYVEGALRQQIGELPSMVAGDVAITPFRAEIPLDANAMGVTVIEGADTRSKRLAIYYSAKHEVEDVWDLSNALPEQSQLRQRMAVTLGVNNERSELERFGIDQTFWMRFAAIAATIYLVQLLVRLYQYVIRLAAFWDSRADAVLLGPNFSDSKPSFDGLVGAMGSDSFDFKPPRFSHWPWRNLPNGP